MKLKKIIYEDLAHYKKPSMVLFTPSCDFKCCIEQGVDVCICQNSSWAKSATKEIPHEEILKGYLDNKFSNAVVFAGLEPLRDIEGVVSTIKYFRENGCKDDIVVFTGYNESEDQFIEFKRSIKDLGIKNVIVKVGRFILNQQKHFDRLLGVDLASPNQYALRIA